MTFVEISKLWPSPIKKSLAIFDHLLVGSTTIILIVVVGVDDLVAELGLSTKVGGAASLTLHRPRLYPDDLVVKSLKEYRNRWNVGSYTISSSWTTTAVRVELSDYQVDELP